MTDPAALLRRYGADTRSGLSEGRDGGWSLGARLGNHRIHGDPHNLETVEDALRSVQALDRLRCRWLTLHLSLEDIAGRWSYDYFLRGTAPDGTRIDVKGHWNELRGARPAVVEVVSFCYLDHRIGRMPDGARLSVDHSVPIVELEVGAVELTVRASQGIHNGERIVEPLRVDVRHGIAAAARTRPRSGVKVELQRKGTEWSASASTLWDYKDCEIAADMTRGPESTSMRMDDHGASVSTSGPTAGSALDSAVSRLHGLLDLREERRTRRDARWRTMVLPWSERAGSGAPAHYVEIHGSGFGNVNYSKPSLHPPHVDWRPHPDGCHVYCLAARRDLDEAEAALKRWGVELIGRVSLCQLQQVRMPFESNDDAIIVGRIGELEFPAEGVPKGLTGDTLDQVLAFAAHHSPPPRVVVDADSVIEQRWEGCSCNACSEYRADRRPSKRPPEAGEAWTWFGEPSWHFIGGGYTGAVQDHDITDASPEDDFDSFFAAFLAEQAD